MPFSQLTANILFVQHSKSKLLFYLISNSWFNWHLTDILYYFGLLRTNSYGCNVLDIVSCKNDKNVDFRCFSYRFKMIKYCLKKSYTGYYDRVLVYLSFTSKTEQLEEGSSHRLVKPHFDSCFKFVSDHAGSLYHTRCNRIEV